MNCLRAIMQGFANVEVCHAGMPFIQFLALILPLLNSSFMTTWMSGFQNMRLLLWPSSMVHSV